MKIDPRNSYATEIVVGLLVVLLVGGTAGAYTCVTTNESVRTQKRATLGGQADIQDDLVDNVVASRLDSTSRIADRMYEITIETRDDAKERRKLTSFVNYEAQRSKSIRRIHYVNATTGRVELSSDDEYRGEQPGELQYEVPARVREEHKSAVAFGSTANTSSWVVFVPVGSYWVVSEVPVSVAAEEIDSVMPDTRTRIVNDDGVVVLDGQNRSAVGTQHVAGGGPNSPAVTAGLAGGESVSVLSPDQSGLGERAVVGHDNIDHANWMLVTYAPPSTLFGVAQSVGRQTLLGLVTVLLFGFSLVVERPTAAALSELSSHADDLRRGNLDADVQTERRDDVGDLYRAFDRMRDDFRERIAEAETAKSEAERAKREVKQAKQEAQAVNDRLEAKAAEYETAMSVAADGDLTVRVDPETDHRVLASLGRSLSDVLAEFEATVAEVESFATAVVASSGDLGDKTVEIRDASRTVTDAVEAIEDRTRDQRERLRDVAGETNNLSATIEEVASTADSVAETADDTAAAAASGREAAEEAVDAIDRVESTTGAAVDGVDALVDRIHEVGEIVDIISYCQL